MTCHAIKGSNKLAKKEKTEEQKAKVREQGRIRKQNQRDREKAAKKAEENGLEPVIANPLTKNSLSAGGKGFSDTELAQLNEQAVIRGFDCSTEYLMTLMRVDGVRIKHDQKAIGTCNSCKLPLPEGCKPRIKGQFDCSYIEGLPLVEIRQPEPKREPLATEDYDKLGVGQYRVES